MNIRVAILKVLSSYPDGKASYASLKSDLAMLSTAEWTARMRRLGKRAGSIDIFHSKYVLRDANGWAITKTGRDFLDRLERDEMIAQDQETFRANLTTVSDTLSSISSLGRSNCANRVIRRSTMSKQWCARSTCTSKK